MTLISVQYAATVYLYCSLLYLFYNMLEYPLLTFLSPTPNVNSLDQLLPTLLVGIFVF